MRATFKTDSLNVKPDKIKDARELLSKLLLNDEQIYVVSRAIPGKYLYYDYFYIDNNRDVKYLTNEIFRAMYEESFYERDKETTAFRLPQTDGYIDPILKLAKSLNVRYNVSRVRRI